MSDRLEEILIDDLEITADFLHNPSVGIVFFGELKERRDDLVELLISDGGDEFRFKIQMIDDILEFIGEIDETLQSRKREME